MRLCVHGKPLDRVDLCAQCCHLAWALRLVTDDDFRRWHPAFSAAYLSQGA